MKSSYNDYMILYDYNNHIEFIINFLNKLKYIQLPNMNK